MRNQWDGRAVLELFTITILLSSCATTQDPQFLTKPFKVMTVAEKYQALGIAAGQINQTPQLPKIEFLPGLEKRLTQAALVSAQFWAESTNFDELAKAVILPEESVSRLRIPNRKMGQLQITSAGIMHTYGYLFSTLITPYGLKSKRWIEGRLDEKLGFKPDLLSPDSPSGEFLSNLTWILDKVTGQQRACASLPNVAPELCKQDPNQSTARSLGFLEQEVVLAKNSLPIQLRTHFIPFVSIPSEGDTHLLAYEMVQNGKRKWITAFPIREAFMKQQILDHTSTSAGLTPYKPRFNLYLEVTSESTSKNRGFVKTR